MAPSGEQAGERRRDRPARRPVALVVALTLGVACGLLAWRQQRASADRALAQHLAGLRAAGKPTTMAGLAPPPVAPERNAAPLYLLAAAALKQAPGGAPLSIPAPGKEAEAALNAWIGKDHRALELLRRASERDGCCFELDWSAGVFVQDIRYSSLRGLYKVAGCAALVAAGRGDTAGALERLRDGFVLSRRLGSGPLGTGVLTASALDSYLAAAAEHVAACGAPPLPAARRLSEELRTAEYSAAITWNMTNYVRCTVIGGCEEVRRAPGSLGAWIETPSLPFDVPYWDVIGPRLVGLGGIGRVRLGLFSRDELRALRLCDDFERLAPQPYRDFSAAWSAALARASDRSLGVIEAGLELADGMIQRRDLIVARRSLLQAALAIEQYRAQRGQYADKLADVRIEGLPIPRDVFSGEPFRYAKRGDGYTLYSVGSNLIDDGGLRDGVASDIVWEGGTRGSEAD